MKSILSRLLTITTLLACGNVDATAQTLEGRLRVETSRSIGGSTGDTVAIGSFGNDGVGKNIRIYLKGHNGSVIDVHTYEINEVAYIGQATSWLEVPLSQFSVSYTGAAAYAVDVYRQNITSTSDPLFVRVRVKRPIGAGSVQLVVDYDDDCTFTALTSGSTTAASFNSTSAPAGGALSGFYGAAEWMFPVSNGHDGWGSAGDQGLFVRNNGNVGIGTTSPGAKLEVNGGSLAVKSSTSTYGSMALNPGGSGYAGYIDWYRNGPTRLAYMGYQDLAGSQNNLGLNLENGASFVIGGGNVGIGTTNPWARFQVQVSDPVAGTYVAAGNGSYGVLEVGVPNSVDAKSFISLHRGGAVMHQLGIKGADLIFASGGGASSVNLQTENLRITSSGNVGIGTTNPGTNKLAVNGTIRAKEVIVEASPWPDDVFEESYQLSALSEVEAFIEAKGHLPGVPSAATVAEQGVAVGEMQKTLLRKIEELTLYMLDQEKRLRAQDEWATAQERIIARLEARLVELEDAQQSGQ